MRKNLKYNLVWAALAAIIYGVLAFAESLGYIDMFVENTIVYIGINMILGVGLNLIIGVSGQFSLGHAGYMAIGAYSASYFALLDQTYFSFFMGILFGIILSGLVALFVGIPTLRLRGDYLAIATLGVSEIIRIIIVNIPQITGGPAGLYAIPTFVTWQSVFACVVIITLLLVNFAKSGEGRATLAVREDEIAAEAMGVNTTKYKVLAFVIGAITASVAGSLYASFVGTIVPKDFGFMKSIDILVIVVLGGLGSITGTIVAAIVLGILNTVLQDYGSMRMIIYSLSLIILMLFRPKGLLGTKEFTVSWLLSLPKLVRSKFVKKPSVSGGENGK